MSSDDQPNPILQAADMAWCAGVIDAIGLVRERELPNGTRLPYVGISTAQVTIAERVALLTGTKVTRVHRKYDRLGCSAHCTEPHLHVDSTTARWSLTGSRARVFLCALRPMLQLKGEVVDQILWSTQDAPFKPAVANAMCQMGWPEPNHEEVVTD